MARNENQKLKIVYLMEMLYKETDANHGVTINDIFDMLDSHNIKAERKSIYSDIDTLIDFGMDIVKDKHDRKTYYKLVSREFELAELKLLVDAVQSSKFITVNKTNGLIKKIESLTSTYEARELQRQVYVLNRVKNINERIYLSVDVLHRAIHNGVQVTFQYTSWDVKKKLVPKHNGELYEVSPWALIWDDENYYLVGYDEKACKIKHYRVDKMLNLNETDKKRNGKELFDKFDAASYSKKTFGMYGGEVCTVKLKVNNELVGVIIDRFGSNVMLHPGRDGEYFTVNVEVAVSGQFLGWIAGLGSNVEIMEPESVRNRFSDMLKEMSKKYED